MSLFPKTIFMLCLLAAACNPSDKSGHHDHDEHADHHEHGSSEEKDQTMTTSPALIHTVFFWVKDDASQEDRQAFEKGLEDLGKCPQIQSYYWGPPAPTEARDVVDNSYSYAINVHFASVANELAYQTEPLHLQFIDNHKEIWSKVVVYDNLVR